MISVWVLISIFLMTKEDEHFICLYTICLVSLVKCLLLIFRLDCLNYYCFDWRLYSILYMGPLSDTPCADIFLQSQFVFLSSDQGHWQSERYKCDISNLSIFLLWIVCLVSSLRTLCFRLNTKDIFPWFCLKVT